MPLMMISMGAGTALLIILINLYCLTHIHFITKDIAKDILLMAVIIIISLILLIFRLGAWRNPVITASIDIVFSAAGILLFAIDNKQRKSGVFKIFFGKLNAILMLFLSAVLILVIITGIINLLILGMRN